MRAVRLPLLILVIAVAGITAGILLPYRAIGERGATVRTAALQGTILPKWRAPDFRLIDQFHHVVSLAQARGRPVILTFLQANCTQLCPVVAETIRRSLAEMGRVSRPVVVLAVSADPEGDTSAAVRRFSLKHGMWHRWHYLTGSWATLTPIWHAYHLYVAPQNAPPALKQAHTSATYLIDQSGLERVLMTGDPDEQTLIRDLRILLGVPVDAPISRAIPAAEPGHPAPSFDLATLAGSRVSLSSLRGRIVLLNFWATWCTACRSEMPRLESWYRRLSGHGIVILGVDNGDSAGAVRAFVRRYHVTYPIALDSAGDVSASYDVAYLPATVLVNGHGVVAAVRIGVLDSGFLSAHVLPLTRGVQWSAGGK